MKKLLPVLLLLSFTAHAQRTIPYPIILIHGFNGNGSVYWDNLHTYLRNAGLSVELNSLPYHLNQDGDLSKSNKERDVYQYGAPIGNKDVYSISFDLGNLSNQSGVVKQGYALKFAIQRVLDASGAKKVILLGHSMGGLAAREYLQTSDNWQPNGKHHVAKLITIGTPHFGSDLGTDGFNIGWWFGYDEKSEAVRDLRTNYTTGYKGVYLFGGKETSKYIQRGSFGQSYYNLDVNSNGSLGDSITGLNQKTIPTDLAYACIIGQGIAGILGDSDGVVLTRSQSFTLPNFTVDQFRHQCPFNLDPFNGCHTREPADAIPSMIRALDEPSTSALAYEIDVSQTDIHRGFFTLQANDNLFDTDRYKFVIAQGGVLKLRAEINQRANGAVWIYNDTGDVIFRFDQSSMDVPVRLPAGGTYYIYFRGLSGVGIDDWRSYGFATSFCPLPDPLTILASAPTTFCEGQQVTLSTLTNLDNYRWYRDGNYTGYNTRVITAKNTGTYVVESTVCDVTVTSANPVPVRVNPIPPAPVITIQNQPFGLLATNATNYQWYQSGQPITNATGPVLSALSAGPYTVRTTVAGCSSESLPFVVAGVEDDIENLIKVQPNPTDGYFSVELPIKTGTTIELTDLMGRQVYVQSDKTKSASKTIDARPIAAGTYVLKVKYNGKELSRKIIVR